MTSAPAPEGQDDRAPRTDRSTRAPHWLTRRHAVVSGSVGIIMLVLAVAAPLVSPVEQRSEVLIITVLFGLAGALMLYTAVDSNRIKAAAAAAAPSPQTRVPVRTEIRGREGARAMLLKQQEKNSRSRKLAGLIFGLFFGIAGMIAPFVLSEGSDNPDARFLMLVGFSPVAISGALMVMLFGRALWTGTEEDEPSRTPSATQATEHKSESVASSMATVAVASGMVLSACAVVLPFISTDAMRNGIGVPAAVMGALGMTMTLLGGGVIRGEKTAKSPQNAAIPATPKTRRAPVARIPTGMLFKIVVPAAIVLMLLLIVAIILIVIAATVTPLLH